MDKLTYHRNGITGEPFHVAITKCDGENLVIIQFRDPTRTAVLNIKHLFQGATSTRYRGDFFQDEMKAAIQAEDS